MDQSEKYFDEPITPGSVGRLTKLWDNGTVPRTPKKKHFPAFHFHTSSQVPTTSNAPPKLPERKTKHSRPQTPVRSASTGHRSPQRKSHHRPPPEIPVSNGNTVRFDYYNGERKSALPQIPTLNTNQRDVNSEEIPQPPKPSQPKKETINFGINQFDGEETDNYIIEAYNDDDRELLITHIEIQSKAINITSNERPYYEELSGLIEEKDPNVGFIQEKAKRNSEHFLPEESEDTQESYYYFIDNYKQRRIRDAEGNPRIQRIESVAPSPSNKRRSIEIDYVIQEMIATEGQYIEQLKFVLENYKPFCDNVAPAHSQYIFGNLPQIHRVTSEFYILLQSHNESATTIAEAFIETEPKFQIYVDYTKNKPNCDKHLKSMEATIRARQEQLRDRLGLSSYLLTPIQRLGKYKLMLESMVKELKKANEDTEIVTEAIGIVERIMRKSNDSIAIDSIKKCTIDLTIQGSFIERREFKVLKRKKLESCMIFLFKKAVVFTHKTDNLEEFIYFDSIKSTDLSIVKHDDKPTFVLIDFNRSKNQLENDNYHLEAETMKIKEMWTDLIIEMLWEQMKSAKAALESKSRRK